MDKKTLKNKLIELLLDCSTVEKEELDKFENIEDVSLIEDLKFDSVELMEFIICVEEEFGIEIGEDILLENFDNFKILLDCIYKKMEGN